MTDIDLVYEPVVVSPPGDTIADLLEEQVRLVHATSRAEGPVGTHALGSHATGIAHDGRVGVTAGSDQAPEPCQGRRTGHQPRPDRGRGPPAPRRHPQARAQAAGRAGGGAGQ